MAKTLLREDIQTEFKSSFSDAAIESLTAFTNTKGGRLFIGINDEGEPAGNLMIGEETLQRWLNEIKNKTRPSIIPDANVLEMDGVNIVELSVKEFPVKPVSFKGKYFRRIGNSNHHLSPSEISELHMQSLQLSWDSYPHPGATYTDLNEEKIKRFIKKVNEGGRFSLPENPLKALSILKLIKNGQVTNAAMLLFSENLYYNVHVGRFKTPSLIIDERMIRGTLFDVMDEAIRFINSHLKVAFEITGITTQRTEIFEYPAPAIRELLLNSLVHRNYGSTSDVQIKIFDQKISFYNPGRLYGNITIEELKKENYTSELRNKLIAEAFYLTRDIEKYGTGFLRIRKTIREYPTMTFNYYEMANGFAAELAYIGQKVHTSDTVNDTVNGTVNGTVNERRLNDILAAIQSHNRITIDELAAKTGVSRRTAARYLNRLREQGRIIRVGSDKSGHWRVKRLS